jgi:PAB1-binding protein PBP1
MQQPVDSINQQQPPESRHAEKKQQPLKAHLQNPPFFNKHYMYTPQHIQQTCYTLANTVLRFSVVGNDDSPLHTTANCTQQQTTLAISNAGCALTLQMIDNASNMFHVPKPGCGPHTRLQRHA